MNPAQALRLEQKSRVGLVGAGGKTTALFRLGRDLSIKSSSKNDAGTVILTATTHLGIDQLDLADRYCTVTTPEQVTEAFENNLMGVVLFIGERAEQQRVRGLDERTLDRLHEMADSMELPLLVEADGSRRRPLKAPADHEPALPTWVDTVCVLAGLSGIGHPLDELWVHRPDRFSLLAGQPVGSLIQPEGLQNFLLNPAGGLKNIPTHSRKILVLNQADTSELQSIASRLAPSLLAGYDTVVIAALAPGGNPELFNPAQLTVHEQTAGVILAAGGATRFGQPKQLLIWRDVPFVRHVALTALQAGLDPVVVVTGAYSEEVHNVLDDLPIITIENRDWQSGQSTSIREGLRVLPPTTGAAIFFLADQPQTPATLVRGLVELHSHNLAPIVAPLVDGQRGNPVLFDRSTFADLSGLSGDTGGRSLFSRFPVAWLPWLDAGLLLDVDSPEDYARLLEMSDADRDLGRGAG